MASEIDSYLSDLFTKYSFGGSGRGNGGNRGGRGATGQKAPSRPGRYSNEYAARTGWGSKRNQGLDFNGNGRISDETAAAAGIAAGVAGGIAAGWTGAGGVAAGLGIASSVAGYADASR